MNRRDFAKTIAAAGFGAAAFPSLAGAQSRKLRIGCTALIWGAVPRTPENLRAAVRDMASLGFHGFETFASIVNEWDAKGTLGPLIEEYRIPLISGYATVQLTNTSTRKDDVAQLIQSGKAVRKHGGRFMVLAPNGVKRTEFTFSEHKADIVASLNEYATAMNDVGLGAGLHQHPGTAVETRDAIVGAALGARLSNHSLTTEHTNLSILCACYIFCHEDTKPRRNPGYILRACFVSS